MTEDHCNCEFRPEEIVSEVSGRDWRATILAGTLHGDHAHEDGARAYGAEVLVRDLSEPDSADEFRIWSFESVDEATASAERRALESLADQRGEQR